MKAQNNPGFWLLVILLSASQLFSQTTNFTFIHPLPGSTGLNPEQGIILKSIEGFDDSFALENTVSITGTKSGNIPTRLIISKDKKTLVFSPVNPYMKGEKITVKCENMVSASGGIIENRIFDFTVIDHDRSEIRRRLEEIAPPEEIYIDGNANRPEIPLTDNNNLPEDYPPVSVFSYGPHDHEYIFMNLNSFSGMLPYNNYLTIIDSYGTPIYYERFDYNMLNFHQQKDGTLAYARNFTVNNDMEKYFIMDDSFTVIDSIKTGNGYYLDAHELYLLDNGNYLVMSYDPQPVNMSLVVPGGNPNAIVTGLIIQEVDNNQNVFFQWRSWDYFEITDATADIDLTAANIDYVHGNALEIDDDGHILLSSRNMDEITKINFNNGEVIWRFGLNSENNMFTINNDLHGFSHQHDIRKMFNGNYTIFDNGNLHTPQFSQVLEYSINEVSMIATLEWSYLHAPTVYSGSMGSFRVQENNEKIIGWGGHYPLAVTELKADNTLLREYFLPELVLCYRAVKETWQTNIFETQEILSVGNYNGYQGWKENYLYIYNNSDQAIEISSQFHLSQVFEIEADFPISVFPNSYTYVKVKFNPGEEGEYTDRLTLNYDNEGNTKRIARQLEMAAVNDPELPAITFDPSHGSENIDPGSEITITFSEAVRKIFGGEITNNDIQELCELRVNHPRGASMPFTGVINEDKTEIVITPSILLSENQQYLIRLKGNQIADYDGNVIRLEEESYFTTGTATGIISLTHDDLSLFPNPFNHEITLLDKTGAEKRISVYDGSGRLVLNKTSFEQRTTLNFPSLSPGIYYVRVVDKESSETTVFKTIKSDN